MGADNKLMEGFRTPRDIHDARRLIASCDQSIASIRLQLQAPSKVHPDGSLYTPDELAEWKFRAEHALLVKETHRAAAVEWKNARLLAERAELAGVNPENAVELLTAAHRIFVQAKTEGVTFDPEELAVFDLIRRYCETSLQSRAA